VPANFPQLPRLCNVLNMPILTDIPSMLMLRQADGFL
jgi:hypothetical protein